MKIEMRDGERILAYTQGSPDQTTYMACLGTADRLTSLEQVLTSEQCVRVVPRRDTKQSILARSGQHNQVAHYASVDGDV